jgi:hypothetical protein
VFCLEIDNDELIEKMPKYLLDFILSLYSINILFLLFWIYFSAFNLKRIEVGSNQKLDLSKFIIELFLLVAFPLGLWFIQPRLNRIHKAYSDLI